MGDTQECGKSLRILVYHYGSEMRERKGGDGDGRHSSSGFLFTIITSFHSCTRDVCLLHRRFLQSL